MNDWDECACCGEVYFRVRSFRLCPPCRSMAVVFTAMGSVLLATGAVLGFLLIRSMS